MSPALALSVQGLSVSFQTDRGRLRAIDDVSFDVQAGSSVGLVGESGCGKSVTSLGILGLLPPAQAHIDAGAVLLGGHNEQAATNLVGLSERNLRRLRGNRIAMIFQEPMTSLNPVYTVGWQIAEGVRLHRSVSRSAARARAVELLQRVGIPDPARRVDAYPHELSGGLRQRVMIAMALACEPDVLIADEPTTALDVTIQAQILDLLRSLQESMGLAIVLVTHDLGVVAEFVDDVVVMYAGRVVEQCPVAELFSNPQHPYTRGLLHSLPATALQKMATEGGKRTRLPTIEGSVPNLLDPPPGCRFAPRCTFRQDVCTTEEPALRETSPGHRSRCVFAGQLPVVI